MALQCWAVALAAAHGRQQPRLTTSRWCLASAAAAAAAPARYFNKRDPVEVLEADPELIMRAQVRAHAVGFHTAWLARTARPAHMHAHPVLMTGCGCALVALSPTVARLVPGSRAVRSRIGISPPSTLCAVNPLLSAGRHVPVAGCVRLPCACGCCRWCTAAWPWTCTHPPSLRPSNMRAPSHLHARPPGHCAPWHAPTHAARTATSPLSRSIRRRAPGPLLAWPTMNAGQTGRPTLTETSMARSSSIWQLPTLGAASRVRAGQFL